MKNALFFFAVILAACQSLQRGPASQDDLTLFRDEFVVKLQSQELDALNMQARQQNSEIADPVSKPSKSAEIQAQIQQRLAAIKSTKNQRQLQYQTANVKTPKYETFGFEDRWRLGEESLMIPHTNFVKKNPQGEFKTFYVNDLEARSLVVNLRQQLLDVDQNPASNAGPFLDTTIKCAEPASVQTTFGTKALKPNEATSVHWYDYKAKGEIVLSLKETFTNCEVRFKKPDSKEVFGFQLAPESRLMQNLEFVKNNVGTCILPATSSLGPVEALFMSDISSNTGCPNRIEKLRSLEDAEKAVNAKVKALLGYELTSEQIQGNNPYLDLDLSKLPKLDAVFVSALVFRGDFYGTLVLRMLLAQAARGAQVRILMADTTAEGGDYWRLWDAMASEPNIKMVPFRYKPQNLGASDSFAKLHRSMHTKLFLTYSKSDSSLNTGIIGGRNIADTYAFNKPKNLSAYSLLTQYDAKKWLHFDDYEVEIQDPVFIRDLMAQYLVLYNLDQASMNTRGANVNLIAGPPSANYFDLLPHQSLVRSTLSFPFRGDTSLEDFYVKAFDSAQKNIRISSPYFSPTKRIGEAMERAAARGVKLEVITGLSLEGDTAGMLLGEVNKSATNRFLDKISMYNFTEAKTVLHTKLVLIDDRLSLIGSVNLNQRSFFHDSENIVQVYSPEYSKHMIAYFEGYKAKSVLQTEKLKAIYWKKVLTSLFRKDF